MSMKDWNKSIETLSFHEFSRMFVKKKNVNSQAALKKKKKKKEFSSIKGVTNGGAK